jgi:hypothetical protein
MKARFMVWIAPVALLGALTLPAAALAQETGGADKGPSTPTTQAPAPATTQKSTATPRVRHRQIRQQRRIQQGVKSGQLTPAETKRLEVQQGKIQADKLEAKSDGKVTPQERAKLTREQNRASRTIYRKKHNARTAPPK